MVRYIFSRGSVDGICATALYLRHTNSNQKAYNVTFCENFELQENLDPFIAIINTTEGNRSLKIKESSIILINLDPELIINQLEKLRKYLQIIFFTDKETKLTSKENLLVLSDPNISTCRIIYNMFIKQEKNLQEFDEYLVVLADLADKRMHFKRFPQTTIYQVKSFSQSLTLEPYNNEFRKIVLHNLLIGIPVKNIDEIRERAIKVKDLSKLIFNNAYLHKELETSLVLLFEYNETDTISFEGLEYKMLGRFSYLTQQLAIFTEKICFILVHKTYREREGCYIVIRKHKNIKKNLLNIAENLKNYLNEVIEINLDIISYNGHENAVSINIGKDISPISLEEFLLDIR